MDDHEMLAIEQVTAVYPDAYCVGGPESAFRIRENPFSYSRPIGFGLTKDSAWVDAAERIKLKTITFESAEG